MDDVVLRGAPPMLDEIGPLEYNYVNIKVRKENMDNNCACISRLPSGWTCNSMHVANYNATTLEIYKVAATVM